MKKIEQPETDCNYDPYTGEPLVDGWPLYSGLPQREWLGLTYKERCENYWHYFWRVKTQKWMGAFI